MTDNKSNIILLLSSWCNKLFHASTTQKRRIPFSSSIKFRELHPASSYLWQENRKKTRTYIFKIGFQSPKSGGSALSVCLKLPIILTLLPLSLFALSTFFTSLFLHSSHFFFLILSIVSSLSLSLIYSYLSAFQQKSSTFFANVWVTTSSHRLVLLIEYLVFRF